MTIKEIINILSKIIGKLFSTKKEGELTPEEKAYLTNDVLIVKEARENYNQWRRL